MIDFSSVKSISHAGKAVQLIEDSKGLVWRSVRLPSGYQEVEYLESTGTQWIHSGLYSDNTNTWELIADIYLSAANNAYMGANGNLQMNLSLADLNARGIMKVIHSQNYGPATYWNGVIKKLDAFHTYNNLAICLFALGTGTAAASFFANVRIYSFQIIQNDVLLRDYIPCINPSGERGMYDLVGKKFYGNSGSGTFVVGPEV